MAIPKTARWAEGQFFPGDLSGNPWRTGTAPTKVEPTGGFIDSGAIPDVPVPAEYTNYWKNLVSENQKLAKLQLFTDTDVFAFSVPGHFNPVFGPPGVWLKKLRRWVFLSLDTTDVFDAVVVPNFDQQSSITHVFGTSSMNFSDLECYADGKAWFFKRLNINTIYKDDSDAVPVLNGVPLVNIARGDCIGTPQNTVLVGDDGQFQHRAVAGALFTAITPAGLTVGVDNDWCFYSGNPALPNRVWAWNRLSKFMYTDDGGLTWSAITTQAISTDVNTTSTVAFDLEKNRFITTICNIVQTPPSATTQFWVSADGLTWTLDRTITQAVCNLVSWDGVLIGIHRHIDPTLGTAQYASIELTTSIDGGASFYRSGRLFTSVSSPITSVVQNTSMNRELKIIKGDYQVYIRSVNFGTVGMTRALMYGTQTPL